MKSGKFYMGHKYKVSSRNVDIRQCYMRHGHGAVTLGSEIAAGGETFCPVRSVFSKIRTADCA